MLGRWARGSWTSEICGVELYQTEWTISSEVESLFWEWSQALSNPPQIHPPLAGTRQFAIAEVAETAASSPPLPSPTPPRSTSPSCSRPCGAGDHHAVLPPSPALFVLLQMPILCRWSLSLQLLLVRAPSRYCSCRPCGAPGITTPRRLPESQSALAVMVMLLAQCALLRSLRPCVHPAKILTMSLPSTPPAVSRRYMILGKITGSCRHG